MPLVEAEVPFGLHQDVILGQHSRCEHLAIAEEENPRVVIAGQKDQCVVPLLIWQDYWTAERAVYARTVVNVYENQDGSVDPELSWWSMLRPMVDLKAPPCEAAP